MVYIYIYIYIYIYYNSVVTAIEDMDLNNGFPNKGEQAMPLSYCTLVYSHRLIMTNAYKSHPLIFFYQKEEKNDITCTQPLGS